MQQGGSVVEGPFMSGWPPGPAGMMMMHHRMPMFNMGMPMMGGPMMTYPTMPMMPHGHGAGGAGHAGGSERKSKREEEKGKRPMVANACAATPRPR